MWTEPWQSWAQYGVHSPLYRCVVLDHVKFVISKSPSHVDLLLHHHNLCSRHLHWYIHQNTSSTAALCPGGGGAGAGGREGTTITWTGISVHSLWCCVVFIPGLSVRLSSVTGLTECLLGWREGSESIVCKLWWWGSTWEEELLRTLRTDMYSISNLIPNHGLHCWNYMPCLFIISTLLVGKFCCN